MLFVSQSSTKGVLIRLKYKNGVCYNDTIEKYNNVKTPGNDLRLTSSNWIKYILNQVYSYAPAETYAMIIGCHGYGWIPANNAIAAKAAMAKAKKLSSNFTGPKTRWFGGTSEKTDISTLAEGIKNSKIGKLQYILFDACYMANVEVAYDLRNACDYYISCPTEIMLAGMPYSKMWSQLTAETPDYGAICDAFYNFYNYEYDDTYNCGTISVAVPAEADSLASIMKLINDSCSFDYTKIDQVQNFDGYAPPVFFDLGAYVHNLCTSNYLLSLFDAQLKRLVPYKANTEYYYSALSRQGKHKISAYSGLSISDPSLNPMAKDDKKTTNFYKATH